MPRNRKIGSVESLLCEFVSLGIVVAARLSFFQASHLASPRAQHSALASPMQKQSLFQFLDHTWTQTLRAKDLTRTASGDQCPPCCIFIFQILRFKNKSRKDPSQSIKAEIEQENKPQHNRHIDCTVEGCVDRKSVQISRSVFSAIFNLRYFPVLTNR